MDVLLAAIGVAMLVAMLVLSGSLGREDRRRRARWESRFDRDAHELRRTDATGVLTCRRCGTSGSERSGMCPRCGAAL